MDEAERRRSNRVWTRLWVAIDTIDSELHPCRANVSATGVYFDHQASFGEAGTVYWIHLSSFDRAVTVAIMACVVRSTGGDGPKGGVAFEFMPESDAAQLELRNFLHYVLALATEDIKDRAPRAKVRALSLEWNWAIPNGTPIRVEIVAGSERAPIRFEGHTAQLRDAGSGCFHVNLVTKGDSTAPRRFSSRSMTALRVANVRDASSRYTPLLPQGTALAPAPALSDSRTSAEELEGIVGTLLDLQLRPKPEPPSHLVGDLASISFPALLSLLDMEKLTGEFVIERASERRTLFFRHGQIVDLEPLSADADVRACVRRVLGATKGRFQFIVTAVDRPDRVATTTMALLLDLAHENDELARSSRE